MPGEEKIIREYAIGFGRFEIMLPKGAEVLGCSQMRDRPFVCAITDVLLTAQETRVFHLIESFRGFILTPNMRHIGSIFALQKLHHCFVEEAQS